MEIVRDVKEKLTVAMDNESELAKAETLSDLGEKYGICVGHAITIAIGFERFRCIEVLLEPSLLGKKSAGVHVDQLASDSAISGDVDSHYAVVRVLEEDVYDWQPALGAADAKAKPTPHIVCQVGQVSEEPKAEAVAVAAEGVEAVAVKVHVLGAGACTRLAALARSDNRGSWLDRNGDGQWQRNSVKWAR